ncbi:Fe2+-dependent dioxygenase [Prochlorococcus marinus]|uniref:Fe2+-dependent dioxygenase n=1 Tax=Prochlorococcus marinus TaxID=1219 RepID=UPI0022B45333|nr:Fe2+-dependent dioxygenase [Prochlorococcus marinus]
MLYLAHKLLNEGQVKDLRKSLMLSTEWVDGKNSARGSKVKKNIQLNLGETYNKLSKEIIEIIDKDELSNNFSFPSKIFNILFTRTGEGMFYGPHVDVAFTPKGRRDLSFTIFLNQPTDYEGGELILYITPEKKQIKMNPGEMIIYPTKYLHEVKTVTQGERMVCVGWIESQIPRDDDRESLYLMNQGMSSITNEYGHSAATQNLKISFNNIYKRFMN